MIVTMRPARRTYSQANSPLFLALPLLVSWIECLDLCCDKLRLGLAQALGFGMRRSSENASFDWPLSRARTPTVGSRASFAEKGCLSGTRNRSLQWVEFLTRARSSLNGPFLGVRENDWIDDTAAGSLVDDYFSDPRNPGAYNSTLVSSPKRSQPPTTSTSPLGKRTAR